MLRINFLNSSAYESLGVKPEDKLEQIDARKFNLRHNFRTLCKCAGPQVCDWNPLLPAPDFNIVDVHLVKTVDLGFTLSSLQRCPCGCGPRKEPICAWLIWFGRCERCRKVYFDCYSA
jgi:hypothetical protein